MVQLKPAARCLLAALAALPLLAGCGRSGEPEDFSTHATGVVVAEARIDTLRDVANASGMIVPSTAADWTIHATENAEIAELPKKPQDPVAVGDLLVRFDIAAFEQELSALQLQVIDASSRMDRAKAELARQSSLFERGITSRNNFDTSRLEASAAESNLAQAKAQLAAIQTGDERSVVRARFAGVVTDVWHAVGDTVRPGTDDPILRVIDPARVQVAVQLPVAQLSRVNPGQTATVRAIAAIEEQTATVVSKAGAIDIGSPTGEVRLAFNTPVAMPLNTAASVEILLDQRRDAVVIPVAGVRRDELGSFVVVVGGDSLARRRDVRVGLVGREMAQIASGLEVGERVIVSDISEISELSPVFISR